MAYELGYFTQEGLTVERPVMVRSWKILTESFLAGKFNFTHMLFPIPVWMRFKQGIPVKVLAWDHTNGSAVTVRGESDIYGFKDLGGTQVAVPSWYSMHNLLMQLGLTTQGLTPVIRPQSAALAPNEVNLFILPPPDMPTALLAKKSMRLSCRSLQCPGRRKISSQDHALLRRYLEKSSLLCYCHP